METTEHQANKILFQQKTLKNQADQIAEQAKRVAELEKNKKK